MADNDDKGMWAFNKAVRFRGEPEDINTLWDRYTNIHNALAVHEAEILRRIFLAGLEALEKDPDLSAKLNGTTLEVTRRHQSILRRKAEEKRMELIYQDEGCDPQRFAEWCLSAGMTREKVDNFLSNYTLQRPSWRRNATEWLREYLEDGGTHPTDQIRQAAVEADIITTAQKDWDKLRQVASDEGFTTGQRGYWHIPL